VQEFVTFVSLQGMITLVEWWREPRKGPGLGSPKPFPMNSAGEEDMFTELLRNLWREQEGQDIAEYAVMLAVILVIVVGTIRLIGSNANNVFSNVASSIQ
jgi:Flp pilus assembly pilin Flp